MIGKGYKRDLYTRLSASNGLQCSNKLTLLKCVHVDSSIQGSRDHQIQFRVYGYTGNGIVVTIEHRQGLGRIAILGIQLGDGL